jgi:hypothetical protein
MLILIAAIPTAAIAGANPSAGTVAWEKGGWLDHGMTWECATTNAAAVLLRRNSPMVLHCAGGRRVL